MPESNMPFSVPSRIEKTDFKKGARMGQNFWSTDLYLGIPALDGPHEELLAELARLAVAPDGEFGASLFAVIARLESDFRAEEDLMEVIGWPALARHREQHARALSGLHHVVPRVMNGDIACGREAAELLRHWFAFHVSTMDAVLAVALEQAGTKVDEAQAPE
jgi:hemerythrin